MRILVVGLGSMGQRRIRCLKELGFDDIVGLDHRLDRVIAASKKFQIELVSNLDDVTAPINVVIVSTPPSAHRAVLEWASDRAPHAFVEASVSSGEEAEAMRALSATFEGVCVPSCTMKYFRGPERVKELVSSGTVGEPLFVNYHVGQYLPDWHPWEDIRDFYVSNRETGGCREIVPFEFTWLNDVFGEPHPIACSRGKLSDLPADIDDYYHIVVQYPEGPVAAVTVEVLSRPRATREFRLVGSHGTVTFGGYGNVLEVALADETNQAQQEALYQGEPAPGYVYPELPYLKEMRDFMLAVEQKDASLFPSDFSRDAKVIHLLNRLEAMS